MSSKDDRFVVNDPLPPFISLCYPKNSTMILIVVGFRFSPFVLVFVFFFKKNYLFSTLIYKCKFFNFFSFFFLCSFIKVCGFQFYPSYLVFFFNWNNSNFNLILFLLISFFLSKVLWSLILSFKSSLFFFILIIIIIIIIIIVNHSKF